MKKYICPIFETIAFAALVLALGCTSNSAGPAVSASDLTYSKDPRTGICYASMNSLDGHSGWKTTTITYVPCTPEVEKAISK
jgi:hypothetical protein